jgi:hypothetical protein
VEINNRKRVTISIKYDQISIIFQEYRNYFRYDVSIYIQNSKNMRDGMQKNCGSSDWKAWARREMVQILWLDGLTLLEVLKEPEFDCGGDLLAYLRDRGGQ